MQTLRQIWRLFPELILLHCLNSIVLVWLLRSFVWLKGVGWRPGFVCGRDSASSEKVLPTRLENHSLVRIHKDLIEIRLDLGI